MCGLGADNSSTRYGQSVSNVQIPNSPSEVWHSFIPPPVKPVLTSVSSPKLTTHSFQIRIEKNCINKVYPPRYMNSHHLVFCGAGHPVSMTATGNSSAGAGDLGRSS